MTATSARDGDTEGTPSDSSTAVKAGTDGSDTAEDPGQRRMARSSSPTPSRSQSAKDSHDPAANLASADTPGASAASQPIISTGSPSTVDQRDTASESAQVDLPTASSGPGGNGQASQNGNGHANGNGSGTQSTSWLQKVKTLLGWRSEASLRESLEDSLTREDGTLDAVFDPSERMLLKNILRLREQRIVDVMIPRVDIDAIEEAASIAEALEAFRKSGHSRMPVYGETLDDPLGLIHIKDIMTLLAENNAQQLKEDDEDEFTFEMSTFDFAMTLAKAKIRRPILYVPPSMPVMDLMAKMQANRIQMALVIDEYGGTDGLVSLEDIVETVVGDIEDEHDEDEQAQISNPVPDVWVADGRIPIEDLAEEIGERFQISDSVEEVDTLGGLLFTIAGRVPARGELISSDLVPGFEFEVTDADPRRIKRLRIRRVEINPADDHPGPAATGAADDKTEN